MKNICYNPTWIATTEHPYEHYTRSILFAVLMLGALVYLYFISASVVNLMARREAHVLSLQTSSQVSELEARYLALTNSLSQEEGEALGLRALEPVAYVRASAPTAFAQAPTAF
ncbi:hypothetical protein EBR66_02790 [bacterium]|nr:hypothetical protein [bacterium]